MYATLFLRVSSHSQILHFLTFDVVCASHIFEGLLIQDMHAVPQVAYCLSGHLAFAMSAAHCTMTAPSIPGYISVPLAEDDVTSLFSQNNIPPACHAIPVHAKAGKSTGSV